MSKMAAPAVQNPAVHSESKSSKKKKAKADRTDSPAPAATLTPDKPTSVSGNDAGDDSESPYIRELQKNIRNLNKKILAASKIDAILAEHPGKTTDDLVAQKLINADQKAQHAKKPGMQAQLSQLEEQVAQYKKLDSEYRGRASSAKAELEKSLTDKHEKDKADAIAEVKAAAEKKAAAELKQKLHDSFLVLSQFLRLAAARRAEGADQQLDENLALEGVLLNTYSGDENAVSTILRLVHGSDDRTTDVSGSPLQTTYAQVKAAAIQYAAPASQVDASAELEEGARHTEPVSSDPTLAHASLTEIDSGTNVALTNGHTEESPVNGALTGNADVSDNAANATAEANWDPAPATLTSEMSASQEWVDVKLPRDLSETETGLTATLGSTANTQSWADEQPEIPHESSFGSAADPANDGFHQVQRNHRGRGDREGGWRGGRGGERGGGYRGRGGYRGDGRGRGGRGPRGGGGMPSRGPRRDES